MLNIKIIAIGKLKEKYLQEACAEYIKRLGAFCKLTVYEINESRLPDNPSKKEIEKSLSAEAKNVLRYVQGFVIAMCIDGKLLTSVEFSEKINRVAIEGNSTISFIIGSSHGLSDEVIKNANLKLSMSKMTFPHQLARVLLLEQLYRAFHIANGGKYHK